jgi:hypothetical protein
MRARDKEGRREGRKEGRKEGRVLKRVGGVEIWREDGRAKGAKRNRHVSTIASSVQGRGCIFSSFRS